jgi:hypothetical protein
MVTMRTEKGLETIDMAFRWSLVWETVLLDANPRGNFPARLSLHLDTRP